MATTINLETVYSFLSDFASLDSFWQKFDTIFGTIYDRPLAESLKARSPNVQVSTLVIFDSRVQDLDTLYRSLLPDSFGYTIAATDDALTVITQLLSATGATRLAIAAHGESGVVHLGAKSLDKSQILAKAGLLQEWCVQEIALYACEVASGSTGADFVNSLANVTGASIAASVSKVGNSALGGTWDLGVTVGSTSSLLDRSLLQSYAGILPQPNDTWEDAIALTLNTPLTGSWNTATNDYQFTTTKVFTGLGQTTTQALGSDVVYKFTAPSAGTYSFRVTGPSASAPNFVLYALNSLPATTAGTPLNLTSATILGGANRTSSTATTAEEIYGISLTAGQTIYVVADISTNLASTASFTIEANQIVTESDTTVSSTTNDTPATANTFVFGIEGSIGVAGDKDFYSIGTPTSGSRVFAMIDALAANQTDFDLRVTTATDTLEYDDGDGDALFGGTFTPSISGTPLTGGSSYVRVNYFGNTTTSEPYRLYAVVQPALASATAETVSSNDTIATAQVASNNYFSGALSSATDIDFYAFTARVGDLIFLSLDSNPTRDATTFDGRLALFNAAGTSLVGTNGVNGGVTGFTSTSGAGNLAASNPTSPSEGLVYRVIMDGIYYARANAAGTTFGDYLLSVSINGALGSSSLSPSSQLPTATNLNAAETYTEDIPLNLTDIVVNDTDNTNVTATLTLSNSGAGSLSTGTSGAVTSTFVNGVWTATGAIADVNALLAGVTFTSTANFNSNFTITTSISDGFSVVTGSKAFTGIAVNDAPVYNSPASNTFGYSASVASYQAINLIPGASGVSSFANLASTDDNFEALSLGSQSFNFYGINYSTIFVSSNGLITFGSGNSAFSNNSLTTSVTQPAIAVFWDDLVTDKNADDQVLFQFQDLNADTIPDRLVIEWNNVFFFNATTNAITFQAILQLNTGTNSGNITLNYVDTDTGNVDSINGASATVGIKNGNGDPLLVSFNNGNGAYVNSLKAIEFTTQSSILTSGTEDTSTRWLK